MPTDPLKITFFHITRVLSKDGYIFINLEGLHEELSYEIQIALKQNMSAASEQVIEENGLYFLSYGPKSDSFIKTLSRKYLGIEHDTRKMKETVLIHYLMVSKGDTIGLKKDLTIVGKIGNEYINFFLEIFPKKQLASVYLEDPKDVELLLNYFTE